jgi:hypothetical protein
VPRRKQRVVGARAYIGLPSTVEGHDNRIFVFTQFSRDAPSDGSVQNVFSCELYEKLLAEVHAFAKCINVEFKEVECPVSNQERCPKCGFSYGWDGSSCAHCHYLKDA